MAVSLGDFLDALRVRGGDAKADMYLTFFVKVYCPPMTKEQLLSEGFDELCTATKMLRELKHFSTKNPSLPTKTSNSRIVYGEHYYKKYGAPP